MPETGRRRTVAVCSDIHANLAALEAVLADVDARGIDEVWCLGDVVGNGDDIVDCIDLVRERCTIVLAGNHDLIALGSIPPRDPARLRDPRLRRTIDLLAAAGAARRQWLASRPSEHEVGEVVLAHGCPAPFDPVRDYLGEDVDPQAILDARPDRSLFVVGHTHVSGAWAYGRDPDRRVLNAGSVGDARQERATWLELEVPGHGSAQATWHAAEYR